MSKSEAETRVEFIDKQLALAGWDVNDPTQVTQEFDITVDLPDGVSEPRTPYEGHQFSDYVLLGKNGKPLAVVEAKKSSKDAKIGREQAKQYFFLLIELHCVNKALDAFKEHLPNEPRWPNIGEKVIAKDRRIYISTYPSMLNIIRDESQPLSPHFFDFIIIDESHRSIYNTFGEILDYFKAISLGLTATPTSIVDHNTFELFDCKDGIPSFAYTYEEAVNNTPPYLSNFEVMKIKTKFQIDGISKRTISLEDQKILILEGKEVAEIEFEGTQLEKSVTNKGTNTLIVKEFMEECIKDSNGVIPGKTIFFCSTIKHARRIEEIFDELYPEYSGELAKVLVSDDSRVYGKGGLLDQFTNRDMPRIAISVDMLDTGIDVRELVNLVFAKPVYSYTKFWQMIGRGTRLLEPTKIKPWCTEKEKFLILDCWDNFEYFKLQPKGKEPKPQLPLPVKLVEIRIDKIEKAVDLGQTEIAEKEIIKLREQIDKLPQNSAVIKEAATALSKLEDENFWIALNHQKIESLRSEIKPLFRTVSDVDYKEMRFERDVLELSLAHLADDSVEFEKLKIELVEQISELPLTHNFVQREEKLIRDLQKSHYWATVTNDTLDTLVEKLAPLMKFRDSSSDTLKTASFNFQDELKNKEFVEFGPEHEATNITKYKEMVEQLILDLTDENPILKRIKEGEKISSEDAESLAKFLQKERPHITEDLLRTVYQNRKARFIQFIRHILKIEILKTFPDTVAEAFELFIQEHSNLSTRQLDFLNLLKNFILEREKVEKRDLINAPFTVIHPQGIRGVFSATEINDCH